MLSILISVIIGIGAGVAIGHDLQSLPWGIVCGIGGSYLGARAAIDALSHSFYNILPHAQRKTPAVFFAASCIFSAQFAQSTSIL